MDIKEVKELADIVSIVSKKVRLARFGNIYKGLCPFHSEKTPSFAVYPNKQRFRCYGCGKRGDVVDFVALTEGKSTSEALAVIQNKSILEYIPPPPPVDTTPEKWQLITPCPIASQIIHPKLGKPAMTWLYRSAQNEPLYYVCRFNKPDGKKEFRPYTYWTDGEKKIWKWAGFSKPRPLYGLEFLKTKEKATVMLVEGEKTADAARLLFPHILVLTWHGGASAVKSYDWTVLKGRRIILMPDNDWSHQYGDSHELAGQTKPWSEQPGNMAMLQIWEELKPICKKIAWCESPPEMPCGWDWADANIGDSVWTNEQAIEFVRANNAEVEVVISRNNQTPPPPPDRELPDSTPEDEPTDPEYYETLPQDVQILPQIKQQNNKAFPFKFLGTESLDGKMRYWFFSPLSEKIVGYTSKQLSEEASIKELAPAYYWESEYPAKKNSKINLSAVAEELRYESNKIGNYDKSDNRGRGAWSDEERIIIHTGDRIVLNGNSFKISDFETQFIYENKPSLELKIGKPLTTLEANKLIQICESFEWERKISGKLLAGWIVIAPFCGVLTWRPHLWVIGGAGTGKSWILRKVVRKCLGKFQLPLQSNTTEAAVRQDLNSDALPVIFDEFESETERDYDRTKTIIELARGSSSEDSGDVTKGSVGGKVTKYRLRSVFLFASIAQSLVQQSDISRITTLALKPSTPQQKEANAKFVEETLTNEYTQALQSRTIKHLPTIIKNIKTLSKCVAEYLNDQRIGDQLGCMLAGAYSLSSSKEITHEQAMEFITKQDWEEDKVKDESKDEYRLLQTILEHLTKVDVERGSVEKPIGELIFIAAGEEVNDAKVTIDSAEDRLRQIGIVYKDNMVWFSNTNSYLRRTVLKGTPWALGYAKLLATLPDCQKKDMRFGHGIKTRAVGIPFDSINVKE